MNELFKKLMDYHIRMDIMPSEMYFGGDGVKFRFRRHGKDRSVLLKSTDLNLGKEVMSELDGFIEEYGFEKE